MHTWLNYPFCSDQPVSNGTFVECRTFDGICFVSLAEDVDWKKNGSSNDVVAYRVVGYDDRDY